ncbi:hypothetical protein CLOM_g8357 [Closterium sp. NIES-68]|nr:hypothetical protein CLOM_g8357 [Closterium sp. NIES-68]GJP77412.1 hypothetical protein CLOP_g7809 [Closterium sp. NIES-67]
MESPLSLPCPAFEGFEKRLDVEFTWKKTILPELKCKGLRSASRAALDAMLDDAQCTIVSKMSNEHLDAYVLSESSLFVFPTRAVIKTCGTTRLLNAIPKLLEIATEAGLEPARCRFSRGTFLFPEAQLSPHRSFDEEIAVLDGFFGGLKHRRAHIMGDVLGSRKWHVYVAGELPTAVIPAAATCAGGVASDGSAGGSVVTVEVCMTDLGRAATKYFFKSNGYGDAADVTGLSGIGDLVPHSRIDDFNFDPCGYSMNGLDGEVISTVHITPEDGFSYASFEVMGSVGVGAKGPLWHATGGDLGQLVAKTARTFLPGRLTVAVHSSQVAAEGVFGGKAWTNLSAPRGYACAGSSCHMLPGGAAVSYVCFDSLEIAGSGGALRGDLLLGNGNLLPSFDSFRSSESSDSIASLESLASFDSSDDVLEESSGEKASPLTLSPAVSSAVAETLKLYGAKAAAVVADLAPSLIGASPAAIDAHIRACVNIGLDSAFYVMDAGVALQLHATWTQLLPRVHPFYAVKCNPDPALLSLLASVGAGFDVASKAEMEMVAAACGGVLPDSSRLIYANPCKLPAHIRFAAASGVHMTTFDSVTELQKLRRWNPSAQAVLRVRVDDPSARCPMGVKYGAEAEECPELLAAAQEIGVQVVGVAFHVGSGAKDPRIFGDAIALARDIFNVAEQLGMPPLSLLDIGGGFTYDGLQDDDYTSSGAGDNGDGGADGEMSFLKACYSVNVALAKYFPEEMGVRVIAEPGRFFAEAPFTLAAKVFGVRSRRTTANKAAALAALTKHASSSSAGDASAAAGTGASKGAVMEYWIDDGIYGSMNCLLYDHAVISARPVKVASGAGGADGEGEEEQLCRSTVFGPTCDGLDTILRDVWLPRLELDDWLVFSKMGAYTQAAGSSFNGFATSDIGTVRVFSTAFPEGLAEAAARLHDRVADAVSASDSDAASSFSGSDEEEGSGSDWDSS